MSKLFLVILAFSLGFVVHLLLMNLQNKPDLNLLSQQSVAGEKITADEFITYIDYDGNEFKPRTVTVKKGNYIAIMNKSKDKQMWLVSDNADLNTKRGYGEGEIVRLTLLKEGSYNVINRLNTKAFIKVVVVP